MAAALSYLAPARLAFAAGSVVEGTADGSDTENVAPPPGRGWVQISLADRVTVLAQGRIIAEGPPEKVRGDPVVQEAYLGGAHQ